jgi:hypothetical protein
VTGCVTAQCCSKRVALVGLWALGTVLLHRGRTSDAAAPGAVPIDSFAFGFIRTGAAQFRDHPAGHFTVRRDGQKHSSGLSATAAGSVSDHFDLGNDRRIGLGCAERPNSKIAAEMAATSADAPSSSGWGVGARPANYPRRWR